MVKDHGFGLLSLIVIFISILTISLIQGMILAQGQGQQLPMLFISASPDSTGSYVSTPIPPSSPHLIPLKMVRSSQDTSIDPNFVLNRANIPKIPLGQNLNIFSDPANQVFTVLGVKITNETQQTFNLNSLSAQRSIFSLAGHKPGFYVLDVMAQARDLQGGYEILIQIMPQTSPQTVKSNPAIGQPTSTVVGGLSNPSDTRREPDLPSSPEDEELPLCDGSSQTCKTESGFVCEVGTTAHECEIDESESDNQEPGRDEGDEGNENNGEGDEGGEDDEGGEGDEEDEGSENNEEEEFG